MFLILIGLLKKFVFKDLGDEYIALAMLFDLIVLILIAAIISEVYGC